MWGHSGLKVVHRAHKWKNILCGKGVIKVSRKTLLHNAKGYHIS